MSIQDKKPLALLCGAGSGLGQAVAITFARAGYQVVGFNRSQLPDAHESVEGSEFELLDCSDPVAAKSAIASVVAKYGPPSVYVHNPAHLVIEPFLEVSVEQYEACWKSMALSAFVMLQHIVPLMVAQEQGSIIVSGATASTKGSARFAAFSSAKFALRGLVQSVAREYQPQGIHAVHVLLDGIVDTPRSRGLHSLNPEKMMGAMDIAGQYLLLAQQPRSVWTQELDLRPHSESF